MIVIIGQHSSDIVAKLQEQNKAFHVFKDSNRYKRTNEYASLVDLNNDDAIRAALANLPQPPTMVIAVYEQYIRLAARINEWLGFDHALSLHTAELCTDKILMRQAFANSPTKISPAFAEVRSLEDVLAFAQEHSFPLILKPANLAKSLLVTKCQNIAELEAAYHQASQLASKLYKKYTIDLQPSFIIEEFMEGSVHSVDAFTDADGNVLVLDYIVDYVIAAEIGFDDSFHYARHLPSRLPQATQQAIKACAEAGIKALGMRSTPAHVEVILTKDGPRIVEIGARNGGYRQRMHRFANALDILNMALESYSGKLPQVSQATNHACTVIEIFPRTNGRFASISHQAEIEQLPSLQYFRIVPKPDGIIGKAESGHKAAAIILLTSQDVDQVKADYQFITNNVVINVQ